MKPEVHSQVKTSLSQKSVISLQDISARC